MTNTKIVILNYQMGNLHSVYKRLDRLNCQVKVSQSPSDLIAADKIILPGVGHFSRAMNKLKELNYLDILNEQVLVKKKPILGICLGMQIMCTNSEEGSENGLSWFDAKIKKFVLSDTLRYKVPHTGWNQVKILKSHPIMNDVSNNSEFYFVHSYHVAKSANDEILCKTNYEKDFISAIAKDNIIGMQFHPEKSHSVGQSVFENFIKL